MKNIIKNWKTSLIGGGALTGAVTLFIDNPTQWKEAIGMAIVGLIGILAKDGDKTGV
jgi:hypothetical protein